jgi:hypothetical protein
MLMQMIPSADAIGQTECDASRVMGARTFVTRVAFTWSRTHPHVFNVNVHHRDVDGAL